MHNAVQRPCEFVENVGPRTGAGAEAELNYYTRPEVLRIVGVTERQLDYWEKLRLIRTGPRSGRRLYGFEDLLALRTILRLTEHRVPAYRLKRALQAWQQQAGTMSAPLAAFRALPHGREVVLIPPPPNDRPVAPLTRQFVLGYWENFCAAPAKVRAMASRSAEEWFEDGVRWEAETDTLPQAVAAYQRATELAPDWAEAHLSLGIVLYQLNRLEEATLALRNVLRIEPDNPSAHLNLGCVLYEQDKVGEAIAHFRQTVQLAPRYSDAHLNLALAYDQQGDDRAALNHWATYLRISPDGPWADYARTRLGTPRHPHRSAKTIPFRKKR